ncbi:ATPase family AAA domain-containing protein 1 [Cercospora beticola]|uniref:ATPase family AAA domain-containing protein 1 n=1 Tax=Cercospora beticola TaxID=122368 RepID=A0A2G5I9F8_CERBT|nr:ATPase family AAA domain-containing protein 1 [Cercospora beticola]PIB01400.1 ATPase family AAA domain-containing protein 1 [Cercospora beticola]WPA95714.1 hypothetical protein RHO25_000317 [Cercospora beticola]
MRCIARYSARLAGNCRVRAPSQSRNRVSQQPQLRSFGHTIRPQQDSRGQNPSSDDHNALDSRTEEQKAREQDAATVKKEDETIESDGTRKPKLVGKTFRQRKKEALGGSSIPKPPPLPDWFLQHNVKLYVDTVKPDRRAKNAKVLRCVDNETGHTLFTLPYYGAWPVPGLVPETTSTVPPQTEKTASSPKKSFDQNYFDHKFTPLDQEHVVSEKPRDAPVTAQPSEDLYKDVNPHALLRWAILQAEAGVQAAFSIASNTPHASSQAASRLDLSLYCNDPNSHVQMDDFVEDLAAISGAHVIRLDANDLADLAADYVGQGADSPESFANLAYDVFGGYTSQTVPSQRKAEDDQDQAYDQDEMDDEQNEDAESRKPGSAGNPLPFSLEGLRKQLMSRRFELARALSKVGPQDVIIDLDTNWKPNTFTPANTRNDQEYDVARLTNLLEQILDAPKLGQSGNTLRKFSLSQSEMRAHKDTNKTDISHQALWRMWHSSAGCWRPDAAGLLATQIRNSSQQESQGQHSLTVETMDGNNEAPAEHQECTIVHIRDLRDITVSRVGERIVRRLVSVVQKRRRAGQRIVIVGSSCCDPSDFVSLPQALDDFRTLSVPAVFRMSKHDQAEFVPGTPANDNITMPPYSRILEINLRHIQRMLRSLRPSETIELFTEAAQRQLRLGDDILAKNVMSFDMVQRIVLTAIGLSETHAVSDQVNASHIGLATMITRQAAQVERDWADYVRSKDLGVPFTDTNNFESNGTPSKAPSKLEKIKKDLNQYESKLSTGVIDAANIKAGFDQVHAPAETIDALKTMSSLSLLRPDAFKYGVLAADRLPGLMLYGPPGTGKTLLAKAVAKESGSTVLEVSGAQIYEKYVGEGEKMVRAVFSLAKKLSPCIVFIDEADAIFGSRSSAGNRNTHREIINQFLREWDGMDSHNVFIMVASNRPFDLDDAVLRRLPRRLLVDLPVAKDRESILKIHLHDEALDNSVDLTKLAADTPLYSGSDLKNLCVSAALACVREENDLVESKKGVDKDFKLPEKRTLSARHFEKAIKEISASISEDMGSLAAIRKFDEQYGDRRNRRKKTQYGFGVGNSGVDEDAARVRQGSSEVQSPSTSSPSPGAPPP